MKTMAAMALFFGSVAFGSGDPSIPPVKGKLTNQFGFMEESKNHQKDEMHSGLDIEGRPGSSVVATGRGKVSFIGEIEGEKTIIVDHEDGIQTKYQNIGKITVAKGQSVRRGDILGNLNTSQKPFIHYEVLVNDVVTDPSHFITE